MPQPTTPVWLRATRKTKAPALDRAQIVREAMVLLDADGLDALSMRKLAERLNSGATSLYWHVANKDELLELVLDEVYAEFDVPTDPGARWRDALQRRAYAMRAALLRHPWAIHLVANKPAIGPNALRALSTMIEILEGAGFRDRGVDYAGSSLMAYVLGAATGDAAANAMIARMGGEERVQAEMRPLLEHAAAEYPDLVARYNTYEAKDYRAARELSFDYGLASLLDGFAVRLDQQEPALRMRTGKKA